jgi:hypothetical protein
MEDEVSIATSITSIMKTEAWKDFEGYIDQRINTLQGRLIDGESGIEIGEIKVANTKVTIVPVIKDSIQVEIRVLRRLKKKFIEWKQITEEEKRNGKRQHN